MIKWPVFLGLILSVIFLWPTWSHFSTHLTSEQDGLLTSWTINWLSESIVKKVDFYQAPFFYPYHYTLAYSQPMITQGLFNIPLTWITSNQVISSNFHLIIGSILVFLAMYCLIYDETNSIFAASLAALVFSFGSWHAQYLVHLHTYLIAGIPLAVWAWRRYLLTQKYQYLLITVLASLAQALNDPMHAFFLIIILGIFSIQRIKIQLIKVKFLELLLTFLGAIIILIAFYWPYWQVSNQFQYVRTIRDAAHFSLSINQLFTPELIGVYLLIGCLAGLKTKKIVHKAVYPFVAIFLVGVVLSLGPVLKWQGHTIKIFHLPIPLPYAVFYYVIPGMKAFRAASRWITVANFGLALVIGWLTGQSNWSKKIKFGIFILTFSWLWWFNHHYQLFPINTQVPPIYTVIKNRPEQVLAELPAYIWSQQPEVTAESYRLLYQSYHHKKLYNGASGFTPPQRLSEWPAVTAEFPSSTAVKILADQGIDLVLIHFDEYQHLFDQQQILNNLPSPDPVKLQAELKTNHQVELISCEENDCLYKLK